MAVSKRLRYEVLRRDNHACRYCGKSAPETPLTIDHVVPVALGGTDDPSNLVTACKDCNAGKSSSHPDQPVVDEVSAGALQWSQAMSEAALIMMGQSGQRSELHDRFLEAWNNWTYRDRRTGKQCNLELPSNWRLSVDGILAAGLPIELLCESVDLAMSVRNVRDEFAYMCGIAWRKVREMQEIARNLLNDEDEPVAYWPCDDSSAEEEVDEAWRAAAADPMAFREAFEKFLSGGE